MRPSTDAPGTPSSDQEKLQDAWDRVVYTIGRPRSASKAPDDDLARSRIPVTILTGFLGSGKTTLLLRMLEEDPKRVLAVVNDLAAVNIDAQLVRSKSAQTVQLENGCACCQLGDNLDEILIDAGRADERPDAIVLEASGVSDPVGLAQTVANNAATVLDGVVAVVDGLAFDRFWSNPRTRPMLIRQLDAAHLIALSKTAGRDAHDRRERIGALVPGRSVVVVNECEHLAQAFLGASRKGARPEPRVQTHDYSQISSRVIDFDDPVAAARFFDLIDRIPTAVYRLKGWVRLIEQGSTRRYLVQAAGPRWRVEDDTSNGSDQLVVIGDSANDEFDDFCRSLETF